MLDNSLELYITSSHPCPYLPERQAMNLLVDPLSEVSNEDYGELIERGFRRSGNEVYRPCCRRCSDCIATRIPVRYFQPNRSQRRNWRNNQDLKVQVNHHGFLPEYDALYTKYIRTRHAGGGMDDDGAGEFASFLLADWSHTVMLEVRDSEQQLLAVAATDWLRHGLSSVYTFFDPEQGEARGLGTFCLQWQIFWANELGLNYVYPGYWIKDSPKMSYKIKFRPIEGLVNGRWIVLAQH